ncbi:hypothetical protein PG997_014411 [Apiospora hydei]|uniref:Splicing factor YJU2 n=1 Tax=Apiospora hydei TaxID=1337664 RepID=A0ABR1UWV2_9PEZI
MAERKVLSKYYPPGFDYQQISRRRQPTQAGPKVQTVRLMAPFSMRCLTCGEYLPKGRKFNARKETSQEERYLGIQIFRFYIRCTRCSAEITFKTDPKLSDYVCERGAKRNVEPWRPSTAEETDEQRLDRLEKEGQDEDQERDAIVELETKTLDAKREMAVADALDEIRIRNSRIERLGSGSVHLGTATTLEDDEKTRIDREDADAARRAFAATRHDRTMEEADGIITDPSPPPLLSSTSKGATKTKPVLKGIKKKGISVFQEQGSSPGPQVARDEPKRSLVDYSSDEDFI